MFRYLAITCDPADAARVSVADRLADRLIHRSAGQVGGQDVVSDHESQIRWQVALRRRGLHVFATGARTGINDVLLARGAAGDAVVLGKLFRRTDLGRPQPAQLVLNGDEQDRLVASLGATLIEDFWGRYVAFVHPAQGRACVLRDPSGALPCFRLEREGVTLVFSWLEDALSLLKGGVQGVQGDRPATADAGAALRVNWAALGSMAQRGTLCGRETALEGVHEILAGERMELPTGPSRLLWRAVDFARQAAQQDFAEAARQLRATVRDCAHAWSAGHERALLRLSGGLDSSILLSTLGSKDTLTEIVAVNYHSPGSYSDERAYARQIATRSGRVLIERARNQEFRIEQVLQAARMPSPLPYVGWMNAASDAQLARAHGAQAMFTGTGGDSLFYEFPEWWPAVDYLHERGLDAGALPALLDAARLGRTSLWRTAALAIGELWRPDLDKRAPEAMTGLLTQSASELPFDADRFAHPSWRDVAALPLGKYVQTFSLMFPMGYYDPLERERAPELVAPLLSQPLVELCLRLPTYQLTLGGRGRALARHAFAADLPAQIARRRTKGNMQEHVNVVLDANIEPVRELLLEGQLCKRGVLDRTAIEHRLSGKPSASTTVTQSRGTGRGLTEATSSQIHDLVALEAWLTRWRS